ncbi:MAG: 30S ribosomal protein S5 [Candidatus Portnoybacteria bacterium CG23_combo_of_CG06-09_8_20_14_all_37_13]|uniref:Small ribosomal subunit protein uS5 n=1 Tax=Candidatus Portnoybacteria bacterium CG23_combo_of_CG06-09_8_20_14_all_37_13 TaxID=1974819 RepID=A0A2G9YFS9_9BACT|nr:MAG: 30S ribosomal protein S5 [Candidatus Portnoybacteria bacterium CG23_combo_of_CG06-09_8_20_14_all_37_13]
MFKDRDFETKLIDIARVTRVVAGGKRFRFRTVVVIGDRKGGIGLAVGKGADVSGAMDKAITKAKKNLIKVPLINGTISNYIEVKHKSAKIILKPRKDALVAGGVIRIMARLAGIQSISAKMLGSQNKLNNAQAMMIALKKLKKHADTPTKTKVKKEK